MTQVVPFKPSARFAHLDPDEGLGEGITGGFSSLTYKGKVWALRHGGEEYQFLRPDDGTPIPYIDVVILKENPRISRVYYDGPYQEDRNDPPDCASLDGIKPDPGVPAKQADICELCPHSQWMTKPDGNRGKECQEHKRIAVLLDPAVTHRMLGHALLEPVYLKIPPASLLEYRRYGRYLKDRRAHSASLITRIGFSPDKLFMLTFTPGKALPDSDADVVLSMREDSQTAFIIGTATIVREVGEQPQPKKVEQKKPPEEPAGFGLSITEAKQQQTPSQEIEAPKKRGRPKKEAVQELEQLAEKKTVEAETVDPETGEVSEGNGGFIESDEELDRRIRAMALTK